MIRRFDPEPASSLSASEAAGAAIRLALSNYRVLLTSVGAVLVPTAIIGSLALGYWRSVDVHGTHWTDGAKVAAAIGIGISVLGNLLAQAAGIYAAISRAAGAPANWRHSCSAALKQWGACLVAGVIVLVLCGLGLFLFIIPGVMLYFGWFVAMPAVVVENRSPMSALGRSWQLTSGRRLSILGSYILVELVVIAAAIPFGAISGAILSGSSTRVVVGQQVAAFLVQALLTPLQVALVGVIYLDLRLRKEQEMPSEIAREIGVVVTHAPHPQTSDGFDQESSNVVVSEDESRQQTVQFTGEDKSPEAPSSPTTGTRGSSGWQVSPKPPEPQPKISPFLRSQETAAPGTGAIDRAPGETGHEDEPSE